MPIRERFSEQPRVLKDMGRLRVWSPVSLLARIVMEERTLRRDYGSLPVISDERNDLAYMFENLSDPASISHRPRFLLEQLSAHRLSCQDQLRRIILDDEELNRHVPDFPHHIVRTRSSTR